MSHISTSHVTHINESGHTHEWVTSYWLKNWLLPTLASPIELAMRMSHVPHINESCHTYQRVRSDTRTSHVSQVHKLATPDTGIANRACNFFHEPHARRAIAKSAAPQRWTACNSTSYGCVTHGCFTRAFIHELYISSQTACLSSKRKVCCSSAINSLQFYIILVCHIWVFPICIPSRTVYFVDESHARRASAKSAAPQWSTACNSTSCLCHICIPSWTVYFVTNRIPVEPYIVRSSLRFHILKVCHICIPSRTVYSSTHACVAR